MELKGKVIIVTGGSGLIGREIVKYLHAKEANVISADINIETALDKDFVQCDITSEESIKLCIKFVLDKYGWIDGLVNSAYPRTSDWDVVFEKVPFDSWKKNVDMQMNSVFFFCKEVLEIMVKQKSGSIVNLGSIYGVVGNDFTIYEDLDMTAPVAYSAIKGGIINLTRYLASYFGKYGIRVNCVSPGGIEDGQDPIFIKRYSHKTPLKRMGKAEEISPVVAFLLSDEASYITGHNLMVDGGWTVE